MLEVVVSGGKWLNLYNHKNLHFICNDSGGAATALPKFWGSRYPPTNQQGQCICRQCACLGNTRMESVLRIGFNQSEPVEESSTSLSPLRRDNTLIVGDAERERNGKTHVLVHSMSFGSVVVMQNK